MAEGSDTIRLDRRWIDLRPTKQYLNTTTPETFGEFILKGLKEYEATDNPGKKMQAMWPIDLSPEQYPAFHLHQLIHDYIPDRLPLLREAVGVAFKKWQRADGIKVFLQLVYFYWPFRNTDFSICTDEEFVTKVTEALNDPDLLKNNDPYDVSAVMTEFEYAAYKKHLEIKQAAGFDALEKIVRELRKQPGIEKSRYGPGDADDIEVV